MQGFLAPSAVALGPRWMRCTSRLKSIPWGGSALSAATMADARSVASVFDGLWHITQYSVLFRSVPCRESATWHWLQLSLIHISEPTRQAEISYAVFCLKKKKK